MKYIIILMFATLCTPVYGQEQVERKKIKGPVTNYLGYYISDARIENFLGTWQWKEDDKLFKIALEKVERFYMKPKFKLDLTIDMVRAKYSYHEGKSTPDRPWEDFLFIELGTTDDKHTLSFVVQDEHDDHMYTGIFSLDKKNRNHATLKFYQQEKHNIDYPGKPKPEKKEGVKIPGGVKSLEGKVLKRISN